MMKYIYIQPKYSREMINFGNANTRRTPNVFLMFRLIMRLRALLDNIIHYTVILYYNTLALRRFRGVCKIESRIDVK